ncbi:uncharacterized protein [Pyxicephalus adspersus]|uniref:uncharacterized protein isoform X2 n=1 Tax=Pyxicephalus adspersus TaxID=30357 RepID=UPI003B5ABFF5
MRAFILLLFHFQGIAVSSKSCVYQVKTRIVQSGGSVIIPCSYSDPKQLGDDSQIAVRWLKGNDPSCQFDRNEISSLDVKTTKIYGERYLTRKDPNRNRTQYIEITKLEPSDGAIFCCEIFNKQNSKTFWKTQFGTHLQFSDTKSIAQLDELMAVTNEDIVIPCNYPKVRGSVQKVTWYQVKSNYFGCNTADGIVIYTSEKTHQRDRYSLVNSSQDFSLHIANTNIEDQQGYCCVVTISGSPAISKQVTMLVVTDKQSIFTNESQKVTAQEGMPVTLNCFYILPDPSKERDVVRVNVYWRLGNVTGPYAYHPYQEITHSSYSKRTLITGTANLHIKRVQTEDNTTFHCFVVLKLCAGDNEYEDKIVYGGETRLIVEENSTQGEQPTRLPNSTVPSAQNELPIIIIIIITSVIILIIFILILIMLKVTGVICKRKKHISEQQMNTVQTPGGGTSDEVQYYDISTKQPDEVHEVGTDEVGRKITETGEIEDEEDDKLLYAKLDETKLNDKNRAQHRKHKEEVLYADVRNTTSK